MKYCTHCGAELLDEAVLCPKCGCWVNSVATSPTTEIKEELKTNVCALIGFILSLVSICMIVNLFGLLSVAGLVLSIVGLVQICKRGNQKGKRRAIAGIVVSAIFLIDGALFWSFIFAA